MAYLHRCRIAVAYFGERLGRGNMPASLGPDVRLHQLKLYVDNHLHDRYWAAPLTLVVAALLTLWVPMWQAALWAGLELVVIAFYIRVYLCFQRAQPAAEELGLWVRRIALAHGAHMVLWSSIVVWACRPGDASNLMFVMLVHVGLISLTAVMSNPYRDLLFSDLLAPSVALLAPPLLGGGALSWGLAALGGLYVSLMLGVGLKIHAGSTETLVLREQNQALIAALEHQVRSDGLTGVSTRGHFLEVGRAELERAARYRYPLALLMLDIDHFKQVNDLHGHLAGDEVLKRVASACHGMVRANDHLARLGGEEFAVLMPQVSPEQATVMAERLRAGVAQLRCELAEGVVVLPRVSIGVAVAENGEGTLSALMRRGDGAMYAAKAQGRNRVVLAPAWAAGSQKIA